MEPGEGGFDRLPGVLYLLLDRPSGKLSYRIGSRLCDQKVSWLVVSAGT